MATTTGNTGKIVAEVELRRFSQALSLLRIYRCLPHHCGCGVASDLHLGLDPDRTGPHSSGTFSLGAALLHGIQRRLSAFHTATVCHCALAAVCGCTGGCRRYRLVSSTDGSVRSGRQRTRRVRAGDRHRRRHRPLQPDESAYRGAGDDCCALPGALHHSGGTR